MKRALVAAMLSALATGAVLASVGFGANSTATTSKKKTSKSAQTTQSGPPKTMKQVYDEMQTQRAAQDKKLADALGVSTADLKAAQDKLKKDRLDADVKANRLTQAQADAITACDAAPLTCDRSNLPAGGPRRPARRPEGRSRHVRGRPREGPRSRDRQGRERAAEHPAGTSGASDVRRPARRRGLRRPRPRPRRPRRSRRPRWSPRWGLTAASAADTDLRTGDDVAGVTDPSPLVLVVDDDDAIREALERALRLEGFAVDTAPGGRAALESVARRAPAAVVLDVTMPDLNGRTVCARLRADGIRTPILILSARDEVEDRIAGLQAGADDYLVKPFAVEELIARLWALLRRAGEDAPVGAPADVDRRRRPRRSIPRRAASPARAATSA